ncbi:multicopper oxidase domain-containing protein [Thermithiobacillus tepidarius DSM 3134]|uniref:multicopper oxidase family protein n=1 Tax=Thermithiobacillus tepidarius TaxID=929 RepID=UPI0003F79475|nr:multicopper oxidase domain-containing protein [Thermithiobacillus tepidarius]
MGISRRTFFKYSAATGYALTTGGLGALLEGCSPEQQPGAGTQLGLGPRNATTQAASTAEPLSYQNFDPRLAQNFTTPLYRPGQEGLLGALEIRAGTLDIRTQAASTQILAGRSTPILFFQAQYAGKQYQNPIIRINSGDSFAARLQNDLQEASNIHWHGLHNDWRMDGNPHHAIAPGESYNYTFTVQDRGGIYWYHPHVHMLTAKQTFNGLASFFIVEDRDDLYLRRALNLRFGEAEMPLLLEDKRFDEQGQIRYVPRSAGNLPLVNLTANPVWEVNTRFYRLRLLNASSTRTFKLAFTRNDVPVPYYVVGTDCGLLERAHQVTEAFLAPAERLDIVLDLRQYRPGDVLFMKSLAFDPMMNMSSTPPPSPPPSTDMASAALPVGAAYYLMKMVVKHRVPCFESMPRTLSAITPIATAGAGTRRFALSFENGQWLINGQTYQMDAFPVSVNRGAVEIWEIANSAVSMPHPMHLHGFQFQVLSRQGSPAQVGSLAIDGNGRLVTDLGWKDTVLVWPGETVRIAIDFSHNFAGEQHYLFHCHNLEHEDMGMMINYKVV